MEIIATTEKLGAGFLASFPTIALVCVLLVITACIYNILEFRKLRNQFKLNGPHPLPVVGNLLTMFTVPRPRFQLSWGRKFGKVSLLFFGKTPSIFIADREIINQILTRDFFYFDGKYMPESMLDRYLRNSVVFLRGAQWKRVRALMTPTFTSSKIKRMARIIARSVDHLIENIDEIITSAETASGKGQQQPQDSGKPRVTISMKKDFALLTLDTIASCCFGLKLDRTVNIGTKQKQSQVESISTIGEILANLFMSKSDLFRNMLCLCLPGFLSKLLWKAWSTYYFEKLEVLVGEVIQQRKNAPAKRYDDYLQILLDAKLGDSMELVETDANENHHAGLTTESILKDQGAISKAALSDARGELTQAELTANAIFLIVVGYETTTNVLTRIAYALSHNPSVQQKLYDELKKIVLSAGCEEDETKGFNFSYDQVTTCDYLDAVICETLRLLGPAASLDRISNEDYHINKYNIDVPKGTILMLSVICVHYDAKYWPEPRKFDPERFMPENKHKIVPGSYSPFGQGPRHCLGMRFSLTEIKMAFAKILMNFEFSAAPNTTWLPKSTIGFQIVKYPDLPVTIVRR